MKKEGAMRCFIGLLSLLLTTMVTAEVASAMSWPVANGSYKPDRLQVHYFEAHDASCVEIAQPEYGGCLPAVSASNQFVSGIGQTCSSVYNPPFSAWFERVAEWLGNDWVNFVITGSSGQIVLEDIWHCRQEVTQIHSDLIVGADAYGAYKVNAEDIDMDDAHGYIDFFRVGPPDYFPPRDWESTRYYAALAADNDDITGYGSWRILFHGMLLQSVHQREGTIPTATVSIDAGKFDRIMARLQVGVPEGQLRLQEDRTGQTLTFPPPASIDREFSDKMLFHALLGWQSWSMQYGDPEILSKIGMSPIAFSIYDTPEFMYEISHALADIMDVAVTTESTSFGTLKSMFGTEEGQ